MEFSPITIGMLVVAALLVLLRVSMSTESAKKVRRRALPRDNEKPLDLD